MSHPTRTLELAQLRTKGIGAALADPDAFVELYELLWKLPTLRPGAAAILLQHISRRDLTAACELLLNQLGFLHRDTWCLLWSLSQAGIDIAADGFASTHEPELNGAFMGLIRAAISGFDDTSGAANIAVVIGDHATRGNEARTGADFGLILEIERGGAIRYLVTLLQAKRATSRAVDVRRAAGDSTQLERLVDSGIGSFLLYGCHNEPPGLGPTIRSAEAVQQMDPAHVDPVLGCDDFAVRVAVSADLLFQHPRPYALPGFGAEDDRDRALRRLFNPNIPELKVNDVLVARIGDTRLEPRMVTDFERMWTDLVARHRHDLALARGYDGMVSDEEREPPLQEF